MCVKVSFRQPKWECGLDVAPIHLCENTRAVDRGDNSPWTTFMRDGHKFHHISGLSASGNCHNYMLNARVRMPRMCILSIEIIYEVKTAEVY